MNTRDLEYLVAVAEELHFGRAAERCHASQPALSGQLRKLEEMEIRKEHEALSAERDDLTDLLGDEDRRWKVVGWIRRATGPRERAAAA